MFEVEILRLGLSWLFIILAIVSFLLAERRRKAPDYIEKQKRKEEEHWRKVKLEMQRYRLDNTDK